MKQGNIARIVVIDKERVLLVRNKNVKYWHLPGGKQEVGEPMSLTAQRECEEELGITPIIRYFVACSDLVLEFARVHIHEMYFLAENPRDFVGADFSAAPHAAALDAVEWFTREELADLNIVPGFLKDLLIDLIDNPDVIAPRYSYEVNNEVQKLLNME